MGLGQKQEGGSGALGCPVGGPYPARCTLIRSLRGNVPSTGQFENDNKKDCSCPTGWASDINDSGIWISNWPKRRLLSFFFFPLSVIFFTIKTTVTIAVLERRHTHVDLGTRRPEGEGEGWV